METKAPGLVWDRGVPIWRASRAAIKAGFPTKRVNLKIFADNQTALLARCHRLTAEMKDWMGGGKRDALFDGTIRAAINLWQTDPDSPYRKIEASSRHPYDIYARMIVETVGARRVDAVDGRDIRRWHGHWSAPIEQDAKPRLAAGRMAMIVLKNALTFAATCRKPGCKELREILRDIRFAGPRPRVEAPTAAEIIVARKAAHDLGHRPRLCAAVRRRDAAMGRGRQVGAHLGQEAVIDH